MSNPIDDVPRDLKRLIMSFHDPRSETAKCIGDLLWLFEYFHNRPKASVSSKPNENYLAGEDYHEMDDYVGEREFTTLCPWKDTSNIFGRMYGNYLYGKCRPVLKKEYW